MNKNKLIELLKDVKPYDKGTHVMWTDPHIGKYLLEAHINPAHDVASRKLESIHKTLDWIGSYMELGESILDLGCGPGLYTSELSRRGYNVTGYDFSTNSLAYAEKIAKDEALDIKYRYMNYLMMDDVEAYDAIMMIYCDFGVLSSEDRNILISNIYRALKPDGIFIFDSLNDKAIEKMSFQKTWEISSGGFWQPEPYICLSEKLHFPDIRGILDQHVIMDDDETKLYRFWNHYFSLEDVKKMFLKKFRSVKKHEQVIEDDVTFYVIRK